jgi:hypothetical protein
MDLHDHGQLSFDKDVKAIQCWNDSVFNGGTRAMHKQKSKSQPKFHI